MQRNIARYVLAELATEQHRVAILDDAHELTRGHLLATVKDRAAELRSHGIAVDEWVVVLCDRGYQFWVDLLALWVVGAKPVCLEPSIDGAHGANVLDLTQARWLCGAGVALPSSLASLQPLPAATISEQDGCLADVNFVEDDLPHHAGLIFTSGTTGLPKGVPLSHDQLIMNALASSMRLRLTADDRLMIATPYRFISSISHFLVTMLAGGAFYGVEGAMMIKDLLDALTRQQITAFGGSPFHLHFLAMAKAERLPHLRWAMSSGSHLPVRTIEALAQGFPDLELHTVYGMSELGGRMCTLPPAMLPEKAGSVGRPIAGIELSIYDNGQACPPGEIGDFFITSSFGFAGYLSNESANAKALTPLGFRTGDTGYRDHDGYVFLSGRSDSVFKRSGLKVSAQVITDALVDLNVFTDVFVQSQEHPIEGHVPVAYFVAGINDFDQPEVTRRLSELLARNHLPAQYIQIPNLPRTGSGKVDRGALQALVQEASRDE